MANPLRKAPRIIRGELIFADLWGTPNANAPITLLIDFGSTIEEAKLRIYFTRGGGPGRVEGSNYLVFAATGTVYLWLVETDLEISVGPGGTDCLKPVVALRPPLVCPGPTLELGRSPGVPAHVDAAVASALERLAADRFTGAHDFAKTRADPGFRLSSTLVGQYFGPFLDCQVKKGIAR